MTYETIFINKELLGQILAPFLESIKKIRHDDHVQIEFPWAEDLIPVKLGKYQEREGLHIKHLG